MYYIIYYNGGVHLFYSLKSEYIRRKCALYAIARLLIRDFISQSIVIFIENITCACSFTAGYNGKELIASTGQTFVSIAGCRTRGT